MAEMQWDNYMFAFLEAYMHSNVIIYSFNMKKDCANRPGPLKSTKYSKNEFFTKYNDKEKII